MAPGRGSEEGRCVRRELNVLALLKADHRYVFVYDDASQAELIEAFRRWATDPALNFNWFDAAVLTEKARQQTAAKADDPGGDSQFRPASRISGW